MFACGGVLMRGLLFILFAFVLVRAEFAFSEATSGAAGAGAGAGIGTGAGAGAKGLVSNSSDELKISFPVEKYTLKNGLTVLLHQDRTVPMVSYHTWYRVGSRDEKPGVTGAAHMLEHMMFKGAKKYSGKDFDRILHENGIMNNAFTSWDYTGFYQNLPSQKLELMMDMEVDRMRYLTLSPEDLKSELQVVGEERRWRVDNNPMGLIREALFGLAFTKHPYRWPVIGHMEDIQAYTSEKLRYFYDQFYVPNNAVLVLAGDFDIPKTKELIEKYYSSLKPGALPERKYEQEPLNTKPRMKRTEAEVQSGTVMVAYPSVRSGHSDSYALDLLAGIMGSGSSSRLYRKMVYKEQAAMGAQAYNMTNADPGLFLVSAQAQPGKTSDEILRLLKEGVLDIRSGVPLSEKELSKAKNQLMKDTIDGLTTIDGKAQTLAVNEIIFGDYKKLFSDLEKYNEVKVADLRRVAAEYLRPEREMVVILDPKKKVAVRKDAQ